MKKSIINQFFYYFILFSLLSISFSFFISCSKNSNDIEYSQETIGKINNYFSKSTYEELLGKSSGKIYIPDSLELLFRRPVIVNGLFFTVFEIYFPEITGVYGLEDYSNIYDCNSDNGLWVDRVLFSVEEERIGTELQEMENIINSGIYAPNEESAAHEAEEKLVEGGNLPDVPNVVEITKNDGTLGFMEFGKEIFIPIKDGDNWIFINAFEDKVTRSFYDKLFRCFTEEKWEIKGKEKEELKKTVKTDFYNDSYNPSKKCFLTENNEKHQFFNEKGFLVKEENYIINHNISEKENNKAEGKEKQEKEELKLLQSIMTLKYDKNDNIRESDIVEYKYIGEQKDLDYSFNKKYLYKYNGDDIPSDFDYYEDGKLKIRNKYESAGTYTSEVFFDEGFHIKTFYEDGKLIKEVFVTNNSNERIKNYE